MKQLMKSNSGKSFNFRPKSIFSILLACFLFANSFTLSIANEWSGNVSTELRVFKHEPASGIQHQYYSSFAFEPKYQKSWDDQVFDLELFARWNAEDDDRNNVDIRELSWSYSSDDWELRLGIRKVFWGVTESQHLVDIINQTDFSERFDGEEKLGQPMINFAVIKDWGTIDFFVLPYFRERNYPGKNARLGFPLPLANAQYESDSEESHIDAAIRWSHYIGDWDFAVSHFYGNSREPRLIPQLVNGSLQLVPYYDLIHQTGLELQATIESWLWKVETIYRSGMDVDYLAATAGLEYSFFDIASSGIDIGIVTEYLYDERDNAPTPFANDTMLGVRLALNDEQSTDALVGAIFDNDGNGTVLSVEANRRLGENWKASINGFLYTNTNEKDPVHAYASDDFIQIELAYYY